MRRPVTHLLVTHLPVMHRHAMVRAGNKKVRRRAGASGDPALRLLRSSFSRPHGTPGNHEKGHQSPPFFKGGQGDFSGWPDMLSGARAPRGPAVAQPWRVSGRAAWRYEGFRSSAHVPQDTWKP